MQDWTLKDEVARVDNAVLDNDGRSGRVDIAGLDIEGRSGKGGQCTTLGVEKLE